MALTAPTAVHADAVAEHTIDCRMTARANQVAGTNSAAFLTPNGPLEHRLTPPSPLASNGSKEITFVGLKDPLLLR